VQVSGTDDVLAYKKRFADAGLIDRDEMQINCCYAKQDKTWLADPDGNEWEFFVVLEHLAPGSKLADQCASTCAATEVKAQPISAGQCEVSACH
jgi:hypothetical protein